MVNRKTDLLLKCLGAALLSAVCIPLDSLDVFMVAIKNSVNLDVHHFWMNSVIYGGIYGYYFIYILAGLPYAGAFCNEYHGGIWRYLKAFFFGGVTAAGVWTCISLTVSAFFTVKYFVYIIPFIGLFSLTRINFMMHVPDQWRLDYWLCGREGADNPGVYIISFAGVKREREDYIDCKPLQGRYQFVM